MQKQSSISISIAAAILLVTDVTIAGLVTILAYVIVLGVKRIYLKKKGQ